MSLIEHINTFIKLDSALDLDLSHFENIPCYVYAKDDLGRYLTMNAVLVQDLCLADKDDFLGLKDADMPFLTLDDVNNLKKNDKQTIKADAAIRLIEPVTLGDGTQVNLLSYKAPLITNTKKKVGIIGISMVQNVREHIDNPLTDRQTECLLFLAKGMTIKQIAIKLALSPRTVEHYLESVKNKLDCHSRVELVAKALQLSFIRNRL